VRAKDAVIDAEICGLEPDGRSNFKNLLFRRGWPYFYAFDLLAVNGRDLRAVPLLERKRLLVKTRPKIETRLLYLDHVVERGRDLYDLACEGDLEGIVGKGAHGTYETTARRTSWLKLKNPHYSQIRDRHELFASRRPRRHYRGATVPSPALYFG
jgi:bifunctional non-homologous end joining protein LigD